MAGSFAIRSKLTPGQARTVAAWRYDDARRLWDSGLLKRMNGAVYLGGLVLDCLLKARLLEKHRALASASPEQPTTKDRLRWNLIYRNHDLEAMLVELPELASGLRGASPTRIGRLDTMMKSACSRWSIHIRYSPRRVDSHVWSKSRSSGNGCEETTIHGSSEESTHAGYCPCGRSGGGDD